MIIGSIRWPESAEEAIRYYINFDLLVLDKLELKLDPVAGNAVELARNYTAGTLEESIRVLEIERLWAYLYNGKLQDFVSRDAVSARIAIALLAPTAADAPQLGDHLSWFLELLGFIHADTSKAMVLMKSYFSCKNNEEI